MSERRTTLRLASIVKEGRPKLFYKKYNVDSSSDCISVVEGASIDILGNFLVHF